MQNDLDFISGVFFDREIPNDKRYLLKYFTSDLDIAFLRYYLVFGTAKNFTDHTGLYCHYQQVDRYVRRFKKLTSEYEKARKSLTEEALECIHKIESGNFKLDGPEIFRKR
jgi:hypothetical protein